MNVIINYMKRTTIPQFALYTFIIICFISSVVFVHHNYSFYERPIAKVVETETIESTDMLDMNGNEDRLFTQRIVAQVKNGEYNGRLLHISNEYSISGAYDQPIKVGNDLFVYIDGEIEGGDLTGTIEDVKRDKYLLYIAWAFIFTLLIIGKKQGLYSIISLAVNAVIISYALDIYLARPHISLVLISAISVIIFTILSLLLVNGFNEKTYAAIVATLVGTFSLLLITYTVISVTGGQGLRYEEMGFLTRNPEMIFMAGVLVGSLGAVMDVAITMSSSIFSLYEKNNDISVNALKESGLDIGKDIMGTMTNILFFVYVSGSIPILVLYMKNGMPFGYTFHMNLSLELARALAGGIGIVLAIPIGLYTSIFFVNRKRVKG